MTYPVVKIQKDEFEKFLLESKEVATHWKVDDNLPFGEEFIRDSATVEELMTAIDANGYDSDHVYVYNSAIDDPDGEWGRTDYGAVPEVKAEDLGEYVVRASMGKDWLYFACSAEQGSSNGIMTLIPDRVVEDDDDDDVGDE